VVAPAVWCRKGILGPRWIAGVLGLPRRRKEEKGGGKCVGDEWRELLLSWNSMCLLEAHARSALAEGTLARDDFIVAT
jgi:hypothetical protein